MDNRRVYKKQTLEKKKDRYLLSKVKNFIGTFWNKSQTTSSSQSQGYQSASEPSSVEPSSVEPSSVEPSSIDNTSVKKSTSINSNTPHTNKILDHHVVSTPRNEYRQNNNVEKTPNIVLSEFFQQKGDQPLSTIEYEGVISLLSQSNKKSNDFIMPGAFPNSPIRRLPSKDISEEHDRNNHNTNTNDNNHNNNNGQPGNKSTLIEYTPVQQVRLRNIDESRPSSPKVFATPEYKAVYHSISGSSKKKDVPSVKRVYQFSGLPSPYRTRIKAPIMTPNKRIKGSNGINTSIDKSISDRSHRSMNKAATTLLSVLDDSKKDGNNSYLQQFSNPYIGASSAKKNHSLTADVINSTIMFDKSVDIPESSNNSSVTTPAGDNGSVNPEPPTSSLASVTNAADTVINPINPTLDNEQAKSNKPSGIFPNPLPSNTSSKVVEKPVLESSNKISQPSFSFQPKSLNVASNPPFLSFGDSKPFEDTNKIPNFSFKSSQVSGDKSNTKFESESKAESKPQSNVESNTESNQKSQFTPSLNAVPFTSTSLSSSNNISKPESIKSTTNLNSNGSSNEELFKFPTLKPQNITLDKSKVDSYKHFFTFNV